MSRYLNPSACGPPVGEAVRLLGGRLACGRVEIIEWQPGHLPPQRMGTTRAASNGRLRSSPRAPSRSTGPG